MLAPQEVRAKKSAMNDMTPPALDGARSSSLDLIADPTRSSPPAKLAPVFKTPQGLWLITRTTTSLSLRDKRFGKDFVGALERRYGNLARMQGRRRQPRPHLGAARTSRLRGL